jgi:DNA-binding CsgD family transcriptional regulator
MVTVDEFSRLVSSIYDAAIHPEDWIVALSDISRTFGAEGAGLVVADSVSRAPQSASIPMEARQDYEGYYRHIDYVLEAVETGPVGLVRGGQALAALQPGSEFYHDWMHRFNLDDGLFVRLTSDDTPVCFLVAAQMGDEPFDTRERIDLTNALIPHLQRALRIHRDMHDVTHQANDISVAMDDVTRIGMAVVGDGLMVRYLNTAAERIVNSLDGLSIPHGMFEAAQPRADTELHRAIYCVLEPNYSGPYTETSVLCPRPSGRRPYVIHVLPFQSAARTLGAPRALVLIIDPEVQPEPPTDLLRRLYGMTKAEAAVAIRLLRGDGIKPIADSMCLSTGTVKTHVQHIFNKTNTHRQAELVRLLLTIAL